MKEEIDQVSIRGIRWSRKAEKLEYLCPAMFTFTTRSGGPLGSSIIGGATCHRRLSSDSWGKATKIMPRRLVGHGLWYEIK
jgi:hypothetical protein